MQLENDTSTPLPSVPRSSEEAEIEADRNEYNLERSLANLRTASQEIDRVLAGSRVNSSSSAENAATSHVATSSFSSSTLSHGDIISRPPQSFSALARASLPDDSTRLRSTRSSISIVPFDPWQAVPTEQSTRQPTPRRPIRYLRASQIASSGTPRLRSSVQDTIMSRLARPQPSTSSRNVGVQASSAGTLDDRTSNLARNVLSDLSQRTLLSDDEAHLLSDEDEVTSIGHPPPSRPASQQVGRWIRLDANGDEIHGEHAAAGAVPLGWSWAIRPGANDEPEKIGSSDHTGNADISVNTSSRRAADGVGSQFSEELIGR